MSTSGATATNTLDAKQRTSAQLLAELKFIRDQDKTGRLALEALFSTDSRTRLKQTHLAQFRPSGAADARLSPLLWSLRCLGQVNEMLR